MIVKKTLAFMLCALLVFSFTGCTKAIETVKDKLGGTSAIETTSEEKAIKTVEEFMEAVVSLDAENACECVSNPDVIYEKLPFLMSTDTLEDLISEQLPVAGFAVKIVSPFIRKIVDGIADNMKSYFSYEITSCQSNGDGYNVYVTMTAPDTSNPEYIQSQIEELYSDEAVGKLFGEMAENGEIPANTDSLEMIKSAPKIVNRMLEKMKEIKFETQTVDLEVPVSEYNGEWLINIDELNLNN